MRFGIILGDVPTRVPAAEHFDGILRQVEAAQRNGFTYIVIGQHFLFPGSRWLQPIPLLARLAAETGPDVRLATQILVAPLYHPVILAEELATLDVITDGRLSVGLGLGYLPGEYAAVGVPFRERGRRLEEGIAVMRALWTNDRVTFHGEFTELEDVHVHIRPIQRPHPPLWIGAQSEAGVRRAARIGDAWPITPQVPADDLPGHLELYATERRLHGLPLGPQPIRREIVVGRDRDDAAGKAVAMAGDWYRRMQNVGSRSGGDAETVRSRMDDVVRSHFVLGDAADCAAQLRAIADAVPVDPVITRANWPSMTTAESVSYLDRLGQELIPSLTDHHPTTNYAYNHHAN